MLRKAVMVGAVLGATACGTADQFRRVEFDALFGGVDRETTGSMSLQSAQGWDVQLDAAFVSFGPVYARNAPADASTDEDNGRVVAQVLSIQTIDALNPELIPSSVLGLGTTERALSGEVRLAGEGASESTSRAIQDAGGSNNAVAYVRGAARKGGLTIPFEGFLDPGPPPEAQAYQWFTNQRVLKIPLDFRPEDDGVLSIRVSPVRWFDRVDFSFELPESGVQDFRSSALQVALRSGVAASDGAYIWIWNTGKE